MDGISETDEVGGGESGHLCGQVGVVAVNGVGKFFEAARPQLQFGHVDAPALNHVAHEMGEKGMIGAGPDRHVVRGLTGRLGSAGVDHVHLASSASAANPFDGIGKTSALPVRNHRV